MTEILKNRRQPFIHVLVWVSLLTLLAIQVNSTKAELLQNFFERMSVSLVIFYVNYLILVPFLLLKKKNLQYFLAVIGLLIVSVLAFTYLLSPIKYPFENPNFRPPRFIPVVISSATFIIIGTTIRVYEEWNKNTKTKKQIEAQRNASELQVLRNQLNPHFFFNSLNSIYSLTTKKSNDAPEAVITLSELMRYMLYKTNDEFVPLQQELDYIKNYIKLQRLRIANNEKVNINIRGPITTQKIRPLLFISFVENAFKYGTDFKGNTEIKIEINVNGQELEFLCVNLVGRKSSKEENSGIGLKNTKERLALLYPDRHQLHVKEANNRFVVQLKVNLD
ncbi:MAG: sensor histidine kinase [Flavobacteriaceae bacterium]|nr:sensor histidine kinase [Flavobacteriaceae bacterium]